MPESIDARVETRTQETTGWSHNDKSLSLKERRPMSEYPANYKVQTSSVLSAAVPAPTNIGIATPRLAQTNPAKSSYLKFVECINAFEKSLDDDHEIGAKVSSPSEATFYIQDVGYYDSQIMSFSGVNEKGERLQLIQHVSQLSVLLLALKKRDEEAVRIGFKLKRASEQEG